MSEQMWNVALTVFLTVAYLMVGIGTARMVATIKKREISMREALMWPLALLIYAIFGDVS